MNQLMKQPIINQSISICLVVIISSWHSRNWNEIELNKSAFYGFFIPAYASLYENQTSTQFIN